jgi:cytochrome c oxidase subunit II
MFENFPLLPARASTIAGEVDLLFYFLTALSSVIVGTIFVAVAYFAIRYRRRFEDEIPKPILGSLKLELLWTVVPLIIVTIIFVWSAQIYFLMARVPDNAMDIYVVGKQWMWKFQHPEGNREINELHIPVGQPIRLVMTSEDVIHSLYIPAFRIKMDVLPDRYHTVWFEATEPGTYHLFCAEYCGTQHSGMVGSVVALEPHEYEAWLAGDTAGGSMAARGELLFNQLGCVTCHVPDGSGRCPTLLNVYNQPVRLITGEQVVADEGYLRESILRPNAKIVEGYQPIMPTYQGQVSEEGVLQLIAYIRSLGPEGQPGETQSGTPAGGLTPGPMRTAPASAAPGTPAAGGNQ